MSPRAGVNRAVVAETLANANGAGTGEPVDFPLHDAADVDAWDFASPTFIIDQLMPTLGVMWIGGHPKRGKSLLLLYLALVIACRRALACTHFAVTAHPKVLYIAREDGGARLKERIQDILSAWTDRPAPGALRFAIKPHIDLMDPAHVGWIRETCRAEGRTVAILDTWTALSPSADPVSAKDQTILAALVVGLAEDIAGLVVVVDHSRKNRPDGSILSSADILGPAQKWQAAEHIIMLDHVAPDDPSRWELFVEGKDSDSARFLLTRSARGSGIEKLMHAGDVQQLAQESREKGHANRLAVLDALRTLAGDPRSGGTAGAVRSGAAWPCPCGARNDAGTSQCEDCGRSHSAGVTAEDITATLAAKGIDLALRTVQRHLKDGATRGLVDIVDAGKGKPYRYCLLNPD